MIYFIQSGDAGRIKIGHSSNVASRFSSIQCSSPFPVRILLEAPGGANFERTIHRALEPHRAHMEWFEPHEDVKNLMEDIRLGKVFCEDFDQQLPRGERMHRAQIMDGIMARISLLGVSASSVFEGAGLSPTILRNWRKRACTPSFRTITRLEAALAELEARQCA